MERETVGLPEEAMNLIKKLVKNSGEEVKAWCNKVTSGVVPA